MSKITGEKKEDLLKFLGRYVKAKTEAEDGFKSELKDKGVAHVLSWSAVGVYEAIAQGEIAAQLAIAVSADRWQLEDLKQYCIDEGFRKLRSLNGTRSAGMSFDPVEKAAVGSFWAETYDFLRGRR